MIENDPEVNTTDEALEKIFISTLVSPEHPFINLEEELNCFDINQNASITVYASQPNPNKPHQPYSEIDGVGHSFITIQQGNNKLSYRFYPEHGWGYFNSTEGIFGSNGNYNFDVSVANNVQGNQLEAIINLSLSYDSGQYELTNKNCTNFAAETAILAGFSIDINECVSNWFLGHGPTPGRFGEHLRNITLPIGASRNSNGGISPSNISCQ